MKLDSRLASCVAPGVEDALARGVERTVARGVERTMARGVERTVARGVERTVARGAGGVEGTVRTVDVVPGTRGALGRMFRQGQTRPRARRPATVAVVGAGELGTRFVRWVERTCPDSVALVGVFDDRAPGRGEAQGQGARLLLARQGSTEDLLALSRRIDIDRVVVALPHAAADRVTAVLSKLRQIPCDISLAPDRAGFAIAERAVGSAALFQGLPLLEAWPRPLARGQLLARAVFDRLFALAALIVLAPLLLVMALAIRLESRGPALFVQDRLGYGNRVIRVFKFRTMRSADTDAGGARQAQRDDPRLTRLGGFLRRSSIDELPQFLNILWGDMSVVGPRPMPVQMLVEGRLNHEVVADYPLRHRIKPGLTGWAQVNGCRGAVWSAEELETRVAYDLFYIDHWSLWFDLKIILLTFGVAVGHRNAY